MLNKITKQERRKKIIGKIGRKNRDR